MSSFGGNKKALRYTRRALTYKATLERTIADYNSQPEEEYRYWDDDSPQLTGEFHPFTVAN